MNLKIYPVTKIDRADYNLNLLFNTNYMNLIEESSTQTDFLLRYKNFNKRFTVNNQYDDVVQDISNYTSGTKISLPITAIGNDNVNQTLLISVDTIIYAWNEDGSVRILIDDLSTFKRYRTSDSLSGIETKSLVAEGLGELHIMTASQTSITTTGVITESHKIYKNGSLQGLISDLSDWTLSSSTGLIYSGSNFWGGEEIIIIK